MSHVSSIGIGVRNEKSLHAALKQYYARPGDHLEVAVDGFIVDIMRGDTLIEIQTRNLSAIRRKLVALLEEHPVRLIHPVTAEKWIVRMSASGKKIIGRRKSPKLGHLTELFDELVSIPDLINHPNLVLEIAMIREEEIRRADGRGSWRRRGQSIHDRKLLKVLETTTFEKKQDFAHFIPERLEQPFSNASLAHKLSRPINSVRRMTFCLKKMGVIEKVGKNRNELLFKIVDGQ